MNDIVRVLVVDDSVFARTIISRTLDSDPGIEVVGIAHDGEDALDKIKRLRPDVVTLDVVMPRMDGLTALRRIMAEYPTPVVMVSALTGEQTNATVEALQVGAVDFFLKPSRLKLEGLDGTSQALTTKIKMAAQVNVRRPGWKRDSMPTNGQANKESNGRAGSLDYTIVIGSSTGGPRALFELIPALPSTIPAALLVVQHMPPGFTKSMADRLNQASGIIVKEAQIGDTVQPGVALVAPGNYHMMVSRDGAISLNQEPLVSGVRPSVDTTMESVASVYGSSTVGIILTGMGSDGTKGAACIKVSGGRVLVEDESTCAVYGMPKSIVDSGNADKIVPLSEMAREITKMCVR